MKVYNLIERARVSRRFKGNDEHGDYWWWKHIAVDEAVMGTCSTMEAAKKKAESFGYEFTEGHIFSRLKQTNIDGLDDLMLSRELYIKTVEVEE